MRGIAQDLDRVLQFGFGWYFGADNVGNDKTAAGAQHPEYFVKYTLRPVEMVHRQPRHQGVEGGTGK